MSNALMKFAAWAGPALALIVLFALLVMNFLPPLTPDMTAAQIVDAYEQDRTGIRFGAMLLMQFSVFGVLWSVALALQFRRIEPPDAPVFSTLQMTVGVVTFVPFLLAAIFWTLAAFRAERSEELVLMLNDAGWLSLLMPVLAGALQATIIGLAVFADERESPLYPRWSAYFNFWCALVFLPAALATFFKTGPFAWSGLFDFWLPVPVFAAWLIVMGWLTVRAAEKP